MCLLCGDSLEVMRSLDESSMDAIVTDPPYGLEFMGKEWDHGIPGEDYWREAIRVAKPGAHLLAFGGTRTFHRLACAIEDAGWEIRDCLMWVYSTGFPKSLDVSKAIDKAAGAEPKVISRYMVPADSDAGNRGKVIRSVTQNGGCFGATAGKEGRPITTPATPAARQWSGWGTALKPAWEPIILARKPLCGTVAENVQRWGTGALNIDGCRVGANSGDDYGRSPARRDGTLSLSRSPGYGLKEICPAPSPAGRWPANLIHDGSEEVLAGFPQTASGRRLTHHHRSGGGLGGSSTFAIRDRTGEPCDFGGDSGSAARFFYCAKASRAERDAGMEYQPNTKSGAVTGRKEGSAGSVNPRAGMTAKTYRNLHPTVKPVTLMRYLCRLVTPPGGLILDPFCGSGSTGVAAAMEGFNFTGIDLSAEYIEIARRRIGAVAPLFAAEASAT